MALTVGSRLGHYDVTALIGEGGMGQVYQATDTKLRRQVELMVTSTREAYLSFSPDGQGNDCYAQLMEANPATLIR